MSVGMFDMQSSS